MEGFFNSLLPEALKNYRFPPAKTKAPEFTFRYLELESMKSWGLTPTEWAKLDMNDKAEIMAFEHVLGLHQMYIHEEAKKDTGD